MMHKTGYTAVHGTDEEGAKRWTVLASFVSQVEDKSIIAKLIELQGKDELNPVFNNYKPLEGLYPPEIAQVVTFFAEVAFTCKTTQASSYISSQVCARLLEGGLTPPLLKVFVRRLREQRTCSWHLEHLDNPFVHESRKNFAEWKRITSPLSPQDFNVHIPRWKWSAEHPVPPWTTISKAPIWSDEEHKTLRESLVVPRLNFCLRLQCLGSFPVFVFVNPWTGLSSLIRTNKGQPRSGWQHKPKKFKNSESNSPEWQ